MYVCIYIYMCVYTCMHVCVCNIHMYMCVLTYTLPVDVVIFLIEYS